MKFGSAFLATSKIIKGPSGWVIGGIAEIGIAIGAVFIAKGIGQFFSNSSVKAEGGIPDVEINGVKVKSKT